MSSKKKLIIVGSCLIILIILSIISVLIPKIEMELIGSKNITLFVGEDYNENGAFAYLNNNFNKKDLDVDINGTVDTKTIGKYIITYSSKTSFLKKEIIRVVNVIDNIKPEITLVKEVIGCKNNKLIEFEAKAIDNYDGDITNDIKYQVNNDKIKIYVNDSSNNIAEIVKDIKYIDSEKPIIKLNGSNTIYLYIGEEYKELGATAEDSCDGDLTKNIKIEGNVDTNTPSTYNLNYVVSDNNGNESIITRKVVVSEKSAESNAFQKVENNATIYLTFDDGPGIYTKELLDILDKYEIKATFFVTNQFPNYQYLIKQIYDNGHTIGIHTFSHKWSIYESVNTYLEDFNKIENIVYNQTGIHTKIFRFPGGSSNTVSRNYSIGIMTELASLMESNGYTYYDWTFDSGDTNKSDNSIEAILKNFKNNLKGDGEYIVLMHDIKKNSIRILPTIIEEAKKAGYTFNKITESTPIKHFKIAN